MDIFRDHTVVLRSMKDFFIDIMGRHGLCIFSQCQKDGAYVESLGLIPMLILVVLTLVLILARSLSDKYLCPLLSGNWGLKPKYHALLPETLWKCFWSMFFFAWSCSLLFLKYPYFSHIETVWFAETTSVSSSEKEKGPKEPTPLRDAWKTGMEVPWDLQGLFLLLLAFYAHGLFALYFQDRDRDFDYVDYITRTRICMLHHVATFGIIYLTLIVPYVRIGIVVVFMTQWCEFLLELVKIFNYAKDRDDASEARVYGYVSTGLLIALSISWIWLKLHLFVTKVLYMAFPLLMGLKSGWIVNLYFPFSSLLNFALVMMWMTNWFWFAFLLRRFLALWRSTEKKPDLDYGQDLFSRFSSFHGWYIFEEDD